MLVEELYLNAGKKLSFLFFIFSLYVLLFWRVSSNWISSSAKNVVIFLSKRNWWFIYVLGHVHSSVIFDTNILWHLFKHVRFPIKTKPNVLCSLIWSWHNSLYSLNANFLGMLSNYISSCASSTNTAVSCILVFVLYVHLLTVVAAQSYLDQQLYIFTCIALSFVELYIIVHPLFGSPPVHNHFLQNYSNILC